MAFINKTCDLDTDSSTFEYEKFAAGAAKGHDSGDGAVDLIDGDAGNGSLLENPRAGTEHGQSATPINLSFCNRKMNSGNNADAGDSVVYRNVATLEDGTSVWGRLVLVLSSHDGMAIDLTGGTGAEILLNCGGGTQYRGETATFRLEFFDPATGNPVTLNSKATFNDLDRGSPGDQASVTIDAGNYTAFATSEDTSLNVTINGGMINASGTEDNVQYDQDAWFSVHFENRQFIEFALEARSSTSGFTLSGEPIDNLVVTPIVARNDPSLGRGGKDGIFGQRSADSFDGDAGNIIIFGTERNHRSFCGAARETILSGTGNVGTKDGVFGIIPGNPKTGCTELLNANCNVLGRKDNSEIKDVIICFTPGTRIATIHGEVAVEQLQASDQIITRDNGVRPLRWIGRRDLNPTEMVRMPEHSPVLIRQGALGKALPQRDMLVSPNHRMLVASELAQVMFGEREVLVAAKYLTGLDGVEVVQANTVSYYHLMFDNHEVILADGCWAESFQPGDRSLSGIQPHQRREILDLYPELEHPHGLKTYYAAR